MQCVTVQLMLVDQRLSLLILQFWLLFNNSEQLNDLHLMQHFLMFCLWTSKRLHKLLKPVLFGEKYLQCMFGDFRLHVLHKQD